MEAQFSVTLMNSADLEQRLEASDEARVVAELEAQMLRAQVAELTRLYDAARRALGDALERNESLVVEAEVLRYLLPETGTMRRVG